MTNLIQEEIDKLENPEEVTDSSETTEDSLSDFDTSATGSDDFNFDSFEATDVMSSPDTNSTEVVSPVDTSEGDDNYLPTPDELG